MVDVSIVIPTYNRCATLRRAVQSVLKQTYKHFEIIIINDGSFDGTQSYLASINNPKLSYVNLKSNFGGNYARNEGIRKSRGKYIAFLDDDDCFVPSKLEKLLPAMIENDIDLCYSGKNIYSYNNQFIRYSYKKPKYENSLKSIMADNFIGVTSAVIIRKELLEKIDGFDKQLNALQDYDLYIRLIKTGCSLYGTPESLINYYVGKDEKKVSCSYKKFRQARAYLLTKYKTDQYLKILQRALLIIGIKKAVKSKRFMKDMFRSIVPALN